MSRRPLPFLGSLFNQTTSLSGRDITEPVPEIQREISAESDAILRRGNWDYMWRRVRDLAAQDDPGFSPHDDPGFSPDTVFEDDGSQSR